MKEIVCTGCSLLCDDVMVSSDEDDFRSLGLCRFGHAFLESAINRSKVVLQSNRGKNQESEMKDKLDTAASILDSAKQPLIYCGPCITNETIEEVRKLASKLDAAFESSASGGLAQSLAHSLHCAGLGTDLEEIRESGEFILYWGCNPVESSHRHASRFAVFPRGKNVSQGVESRTIAVIDIHETETMKMANHRVIVQPGSDAILARALISDLLGKSSKESQGVGISKSTLVGLTRALRRSDFTVIFYGSGIVNSGKTTDNLSALAELVDAIRSLGSRAYAMPMWFEANDMGIAPKMNQLANRPSAIENSTGKPVSPSVPSVLQRLASCYYDVVLVVGGDPLASLPGPAARGLAKTKVIYVGPPGSLIHHFAFLSMGALDEILVGAGSMNRIDMKTIGLKPWISVKSDMPTILDVVESLNRMVEAKGS